MIVLGHTVTILLLFYTFNGNQQSETHKPSNNNTLKGILYKFV